MARRSKGMRRTAAQKKKGNGLIWTLLLLISAAVMVVSAWQLIRIYNEYREGEAEYAELAAAVEAWRTPEGTRPFGAAEEESGAPADEAPGPKEPDSPVVDYQGLFAELRAINPEITGWIRIEGTAIDYPVMHTEDNVYYLTHTYQGTVNSAGSIFMDARNVPDFSDAHTILYGHNMKNGSMFAGLHAYAEEAYYREHPVITVDTPEGPLRWEIFSCHLADAYDGLYQTGVASENQDAEFAARLKALSVYETGVTVTGEDRVLTLSTCKGNGTSTQRFVVHARLAAEPEDSGENGQKAVKE